jgi:hypothetical protein
MNKQIKLFAEQAGFVMWEDEPWNPGDVVDWSTRYDTELEKFANMIIFECFKLAVFNGNHVTAKAIKEHFGVGE